MTKSQTIQHFLLVFDQRQGRLVEVKDFGFDGDRAVAAYSAKEEEYADQAHIEVVLIGSDSLETVKLTHPNYFDCAAAVSRFLAGI